MATDRKGVLLRFPPELLERVDDACGVRPRTEFLLDLIRDHLDGALPERVAIHDPAVASTALGYVAPRPSKEERAAEFGAEPYDPASW